jgi:phosphatidylglycerophosphatase A
MPEFWATFAAFAVFCAAGSVNPFALAAVLLAGVVAVGGYIRGSESADPKEIVFDEAAGYFVSVYGLGREFAISALFFYRVIDIIKPFPSSRLLKLRGGVGIMADDVWCGLVVNAVLRAAYWLFFSGGLGALYKFFGRGT